MAVKKERERGGPNADNFRTQKVLNIYIGVQDQTDVVVFYLGVTYFQFQFPLLVGFIARATERLLDSELSSESNFSVCS